MLFFTAQVGWRPPAQETFSRLYELMFIPAGFFGRIMTAVIRIARPVQFWREGMLVSRGSVGMGSDGLTTALLTTDASNFIRMQVYGPAAATLLCDIDAEVQQHIRAADLHNSTTVFVPCNCAVCAAAYASKFSFAFVLACFSDLPLTPYSSIYAHVMISFILYAVLTSL